MKILEQNDLFNYQGENLMSEAAKNMVETAINLVSGFKQGNDGLKTKECYLLIEKGTTIKNTQIHLIDHKTGEPFGRFKYVQQFSYFVNMSGIRKIDLR